MYTYTGISNSLTANYFEPKLKVVGYQECGREEVGDGRNRTVFAWRLKPDKELNVRWSPVSGEAFLASNDQAKTCRPSRQVGQGRDLPCPTPSPSSQHRDN